MSPHKFLIVGAIVMALLGIGAAIENWRDRRYMTPEEHSSAQAWILALTAALFVFLLLVATAYAHACAGTEPGALAAISTSDAAPSKTTLTHGKEVPE